MLHLIYLEEGKKEVPFIGQIFGSVAGGFISFFALYHALNELLNKYEDIAIMVLSFCIKHSNKA